MASLSVLDAVIVLALLWVAWRVLITPFLFNAVVLFIVFGLLMALAWVRLAAPDVALAEAAIGAGLTGVLLLDAVAHIERGEGKRREPQVAAVFRLTAAAAALGIVAALAVGVAALPPPDASLPAQVVAQLPRSGVTHAVTAVLLNFRGYDTLLEVGVLLLAVLGVLRLHAPQAESAAATPALRSPLAALVGVIVPLMLLTAGYLLWAGSHQPGGAFQAGAVLAAGGVLLRLTGLAPSLATPGARVRLGLTLGFGVFLGIALTALGHGALLEYPAAHAGALILAIESALTVSIALILFVLFAAAPPPPYRTRGQ